MSFTNDDFLDELDFGGPDSFDYMKKGKSEEFDAEECAKNQIILKYAPIEKPLLFFSDLKKNTVTKKINRCKKGYHHLSLCIQIRYIGSSRFQSFNGFLYRK